jgi:hypothetical protein
VQIATELTPDICVSTHFHLQTFLRKVPKELLKAYFARRGVLQNFNWGVPKRQLPEFLADAIHAVGDEEVRPILAEFRAFWDIQGPGFTRGILNEAEFYKDTKARESLLRLSHLGKAVWAAMERPAWTRTARILSGVDKLPPGAWIKRGNLPARPGPVNAAMIEELEAALVAFFTKREQRGRNCKIDCVRQGDGEIFYANAEDYPDTQLSWKNGILTSQTTSPSFSLVFKHYDKDRTLDVYLDGDHVIAPDLQQIFARTVLGEGIERDVPTHQPIYDVAQVLQPGFQFRHSPDLGIADVRLTKLRYYLEGEPWRRVTAEANTKVDRDALIDFAAKLTNGLERHRLNLDQVGVHVSFHRRATDPRALSRTLIITHPSSLRLKRDELGEKAVEMLFQSGIERREREAEG